MKIMLQNEQATVAFGKKIATVLPHSCLIFLDGPLGAGKTTFSRALIQALGYTGKVKSPTYTLVEPYETDTCLVYHFDFYRLLDEEELEYMGVWDYLSQEAICLIEWPERGAGVLPESDMTCYFALKGEGREVVLEAHTDIGKTILERL